ncbi:MAG: hypothetical protein B6D72_10520 [gamma proteobacterium symbiont of Ctena orbiculata]|nr:hypothetical protein [Candidatus Thiodiazotropha taylori]PUB81457.1 MAG: hypothetical protein DBP00_18945 [gamma proteobacterium symbiont of Ctena orbiculata]MBT2996504.1 hypothetical protein [Candidatus Thiodiazotropha taylori]MBT3000544.1 hypothetical protein [Candidatus Thiodiazotropha taylori]MBT3026764.1 hypothetical protein [Candidatus Thiodiazotropha taylori]
MRIRCIIAMIVLALLYSAVLSAGTSILPPPNLNKAQRLIFFKDHLKGVPKGSRIDYDFTNATQGEEGFSDRIEIDVVNVVADGKRDLEFHFLSGENHIDFSPVKAYTGNPVIIHFLERDISMMAKDTGGSNGFFRNRIRDSFKNPNLVREIKFHYGGKELAGTEVIVTPFAAVPNTDNFKLYVNKRYEFIFSDQVPGGIYRIHTQVPNEKGGGILIDEDMTFRKITPAI